MRAVLFGTEQEYAELMETIRALPAFREKGINCLHLNDYDDLRYELVKEPYDLIIVTADGATGMEACIGARKICPDTSLFWFSNDRAFGPQSFRLDCTYFATKPVSKERLMSAFARCRMHMA